MTPRRYGLPAYVPTTRRPKLTWPGGATPHLMRVLLSRAQLPFGAQGSVAAHRTFEPEILAQCPALIFGTEQAAALQLGHDQLDKLLAPAGQMRRGNVETGTGAVLAPLLHGVGNVSGCTDPGRAGNAGAEI